MHVWNGLGGSDRIGVDGNDAYYERNLHVPFHMLDKLSLRYFEEKVDAIASFRVGRAMSLLGSCNNTPCSTQRLPSLETTNAFFAILEKINFFKLCFSSIKGKTQIRKERIAWKKMLKALARQQMHDHHLHLLLHDLSNFFH